MDITIIYRIILFAIGLVLFGYYALKGEYRTEESPRTPDIIVIDSQ